MSSPVSRSNRTIALVWAGAALAMTGVIIWGAMQADDPLSRYVSTDKMRHILAFGAIGLCAGLMPSLGLRVLALGVVLSIAVAVEVIQIPIPDRTASFGDLFASAAGGFGGYGFGAALLNVWELLAQRMRAKAGPPR